MIFPLQKKIGISGFKCSDVVCERHEQGQITLLLENDVMGIVEKSYSRNGTQSKMVPVELDYDGFRLKVTLFDLYVDALNVFLVSGETDNVVVAILLTKIKMFQVYDKGRNKAKVLDEPPVK
ncbi:hypothetical protein MTR_5g026060 [Medicago truncatula]|uniref:Uncharacterized protein n=1 Tax=Medicago truncatula TaxID=3880 RepID=G7K5D8_MEDTR|nr:hypothetical protein MTR_5g026060 [Medicago truncatula]